MDPAVLEDIEVVALSPSRASDFKSCPQLFKFRAIDRLPEPAEPASALGTLVHAVLEHLHRLPNDLRTEHRAQELVQEVWAAIRDAEDPAGLLFTPEQENEWIEQARKLVTNYFRLEDPVSIEPHELEWWVEHETAGAFLRGIIDRVEVVADGEWVLTDYKTGPSPSETYAFDRFFGLRFYALVCWRAFGRLPKQLRLVHLREPEVITLVPTPQMLEGIERQLEAIGSAIRRAVDREDFRPRPSYVCNWCPHKAICPAWEVPQALAPTNGL